MKILIVDTFVQMIARLEEILSEVAVDLTIYSAVSYEAAAKLFKENMPGVVLLNISLHCNESFRLLTEIKEAGCNTSVIVLSINTDAHIQEQCKLLSADYFLDKYYDFEKIPAVINTIAGKK